MQKIFLTIVLLFISSLSYALNLGQIRNEIRYQILDTDTVSNNQRYSDTFLNTRINQVQGEIVKTTLPLYNYKVISTTASQQEYTISTDTLKIDRVVYMVSSTTNSYQKLSYSTLENLDKDRGITWEQLPPNKPMNYYKRNNIIGLVPAPSSSFIFANALKVYYYQKATDMSSDSDLPFNGVSTLQDYSDLIVKGVVIKCKQDKGLDVSTDISLYNSLLTRMALDISNDSPDSKVINVVK